MPEGPRQNGFREQLTAGLRFVFGTRTMRDLTLTSAGYNLAAAVSGVALMLLLMRDLRVAPVLIGQLYALSALGGVCGSLVARRVVLRLGAGATLCVAVLAASVGNAVVAFTGTGWRLWMAGAGLLVSGAGVVLYNVAQLTLRQRLSPAQMLGRTTASMRLVVTGAVSVGSALGGVFAGFLSLRLVLIAAAVAPVAVLLYLAASPLRRQV